MLAVEAAGDKNLSMGWKKKSRSVTSVGQVQGPSSGPIELSAPPKMIG